MSDELYPDDSTFDINDPALSSYAPDIDTENIPKMIKLPPPPDGIHWVRVRLASLKDKESVYLKVNKVEGQIVDAKVIAAIDAKILNEDGTEGAYLKTMYATTQVFKGQKGSQLTAICMLSGKPVKRGSSIKDIKDHVDRVFAEAGDEGLQLLVRTRWIKSIVKTIEVNGAIVPEFNDNGTKVYIETKGEKRIKQLAAIEGISEEKAHLYKDPITDEERSVNAEIAEILDPADYMQA